MPGFQYLKANLSAFILLEFDRGKLSAMKHFRTAFAPR